MPRWRCSRSWKGNAARLDPRITQVMASLGGEYGGAYRARRRRDLGRRSAAGEAFRAGDRRSERPARKRQPGGGGRSDYSHFTDEALERYACQAVSQAPPIRSSAGACRNDDGGARSRLAGRTAARSRGPRSRRRFQSQGQLGVFRTAWPARGFAWRDGRRRRHAAAGRRGLLTVDDEVRHAARC